MCTCHKAQGALLVRAVQISRTTRDDVCVCVCVCVRERERGLAHMIMESDKT